MEPLWYSPGELIITAQVVTLGPVPLAERFCSSHHSTTQLRDKGCLGLWKHPGGRTAGGFWLVETASSRSGLEVAMEANRDRDVVLVLDRVKAARTR
jgi:hypothetical protein